MIFEGTSIALHAMDNARDMNVPWIKNSIKKGNWILWNPSPYLQLAPTIIVCLLQPTTCQSPWRLPRWHGSYMNRLGQDLGARLSLSGTMALISSTTWLRPHWALCSQLYCTNEHRVLSRSKLTSWINKQDAQGILCPYCTNYKTSIQTTSFCSVFSLDVVARLFALISSLIFSSYGLSPIS